MGGCFNKDIDRANCFLCVAISSEIQKRDYASRVINSAFFSVAAKLLGKSLGLISTIIIARILAPEDFGLIAVVSMALYFFDILSHAAGEQYIVQSAR